MIRWDYDKHEILADGVVHALGVVGGLVAVIVLMVLAAPTVGAWELTSVAVYGVGSVSFHSRSHYRSRSRIPKLNGCLRKTLE